MVAGLPAVVVTAPAPLVPVHASRPIATYRMQLGPALTFDDAAQLTSYLDALGVSDCYTSPFFETGLQRWRGFFTSKTFGGALNWSPTDAWIPFAKRAVPGVTFTL